MAILYMDGKRLKTIFQAATRWLTVHEDLLNDMNVFPVPDGDTGTNMSQTLKSIIKQINKMEDSNHLPDVAQDAARAALLGARGNSGVILSQIIKGFAQGVKNKTRLSSLDIAQAFKNSYEKAYESVQEPKEGTILTVLRESVFNAYEFAKKDPDIIKYVRLLYNEARKSLDNTPNILPILKESGVVDAGAKGFVLILEGILHIIDGFQIPEIDFSIKDNKSAEVGSVKGFDIDGNFGRDFKVTGKYGYCIELFVKTENSSIETIKDELSGLGDSLIIADIAGSIKIHIHSKTPDKVLELCQSIGTLYDIKIENIDLQHLNKVMAKKKDVAFVSVSLGEGIKNIFMSIGCDYIIKGGQTMNPSVEEITEIVNEINADNIILLPNNKNIIFTANQTKDFVNDKNIYIINTRTVPEGICALLTYNKERSIEENIENINAAIKNVKTAEVNLATKDSNIGNLSINKDDIITSVDDTVTGKYKSDMDAIHAVIDCMKDDESFVITLLISDDFEDYRIHEIEKELEDRYDDFDVEVKKGGQPYYSIIVSVE
jgi:DAK2 domain fusion protein YloV